MTVSTTTSRVEYAGNGSTTAFSVPFYFLANGDLKVYKANTLQTITTHYTVSGAGNPAGGTVTFLSAPATGQAVVILRDPALTQNTDYVPNDPFPAESHERALDRLTMIAQRNRDLIDRAFVLPDGVTGVSTDLPVPEANKVIAWDSNGTALQNRDATDFATALTYADRRAETFTGDGSAVDFVLAETPAVIANTDVDIEGVSQVPGVDYQLLADGVTIRFDSAPPNGQTICVKYGRAVAQSRDDAGTVYYSPSGTGAVSRSVQEKLRESVSAKDFGAIANGVADDFAAVQAAIDYASTVGGLCDVDLAGDVYAVSATVQVKNNVLLKNGKLIYTGASANAAIVSIGTGTSSLIRPAGIENVYVTTASTATGLCGIRLNGLVRNAWVKNCVAEMNETSTGSRTHYGFEIRSERLATTSNAGAYQNSIIDCVGINCYAAFRAYTEGSAAQQLADPQANGNRITGWAYSCVRSAFVLEEGAIENEVNVRADTFVAQNGLGTTIYVGDIRGLYNHVRLDEEIGARADTQYTIRFAADAAFNHVKYHTQNVVTAKMLNNSTTNRNVVEFLRPNTNLGGQIITHSHYTQATAVASGASNDIRDQWVAPCPCVVLRVTSKLDSNVATSGSFFSYAAKNGSISVANRVEFAVGEGTTAKYLDTDTSASTPINSRWVLAKGDTLSFAFTNSSPNAIKATTTVAILMQSTDSNG